MDYYTQRHGLRQPREKTYNITCEMYAMLFDCCIKYLEYIAWKYPEECPDEKKCCGISESKLNNALYFEIPNLFKDMNGRIAKPKRSKDCFSSYPDRYDQYALLDFIELIANYALDIKSRTWHGQFGHYDISFGNTAYVRGDFTRDINSIFNLTGLLYELKRCEFEDNNRTKITWRIERIVKNTPLTPDIERSISSITEKGTRELMQEAVLYYKMPNPAAHKNAVEKIWDALERLKTYYTTLDKKSSAQKVVRKMASGNSAYEQLFNDEFSALTKMGNMYRIRHHETDKIDITDDRYYEYFFNRCLSLIVLAIQCL